MGEDSSISGFMLVRDVERQGYPFIEAARAALAVCDELVIAEGHSTDRTLEGVLALRDAFPSRVQVFRERWPSTRNRGQILSEMTNRARRRCGGAWCLSVQANEIIDESAVPELTALPAQYPAVEMIELHYPVLLGPRLVWTAAWRRRLFRNIPDIVAIGDAYDVCNVLPRRSPTIRASLSEPIRHYRAITPRGYLAKLRSVVPLNGLWAQELELAEQVYDAARCAGDSPEQFWERVRKMLEVEIWERAERELPIPRRFLGVSARVPALLAPLVGRWGYDLDESLASLFASLAA
jgi:hypothetical protein